jgi:hypothetical protein
MAKFRAKMKPVIEKHSAIVGNDTVAALQAELAKQRKRSLMSPKQPAAQPPRMRGRFGDPPPFSISST